MLILYFPMSNVLSLGLKANNTYEQSCSGFGSLTVEEGSRFSLFIENLMVNFNYGSPEILKGYIRLKIFGSAIYNT